MKNVKSLLRSPFARKEDGSLSVEAVIILPILVWAITATFVFWDAFRTLNASQKATYAVADMLSREETAVDANYLTSAHELFNFLAGEAGSNAIRVSVVTRVTDPVTNTDVTQLVWSKGLGGMADHTDVTALANRLPRIGLGEQMIVVETEQEWTPAFSVGLASYRFRETAVSRPRFSPQLCWTTCGSTT